MRVQIVIKSIILISLSLYSFSLEGQDREPLYILVNLSDTIVLNENYTEKTIIDNKIVFSIGLETLGVINQFTYDKKYGRKENIDEERFSELKISSIDDLNKILVDKAAFKEPQSIFEEVYIVEQKNNRFTIYEVIWEKIFFEE